MGKKDQNIDTFIIGKFLIILNHLHWRWFSQVGKVMKKTLRINFYYYGHTRIDWIVKW